MVTVKVISKNTRKPLEGKRVSVGFDGFFRGVAKDQYTDNFGEVNFDNEPGNGKVYVDGREKHQGYLSGRVDVYI